MKPDPMTTRELATAGLTGGPCENTDRELWRGPDEGGGDFYADSIHVTQGGAIGINCGGTVIVRPLRDWHRAVNNHEAALRALEEIAACSLSGYILNGKEDFNQLAGIIGDFNNALQKRLSIARAALKSMESCDASL